MASTFSTTARRLAFVVTAGVLITVIGGTALVGAATYLLRRPVEGVSQAEADIELPTCGGPERHPYRLSGPRQVPTAVSSSLFGGVCSGSVLLESRRR